MEECAMRLVDEEAGKMVVEDKHIANKSEVQDLLGVDGKVQNPSTSHQLLAVVPTGARHVSGYEGLSESADGRRLFCSRRNFEELRWTSGPDKQSTRGRGSPYPIFKSGTGGSQSNRRRHAWRGYRDDTRPSSNKWPSRTTGEEPFSQFSRPRMRSFMEDKRTLPEPMRFKLTDSCKLVLQRGDITKWHVDGQTDAIVNAADELMLGGGGVDGAIHRAAGHQLLKACQELPRISGVVRCPVGEAVVTRGFKLPVPQIIHTVGPKYKRSEKEGSAALLENAYKNSLSLARRQGVKYIAFPAISCGVYGYPTKEAAKIALKTVKDYADGFVEIHFVLFEASACNAWLAEAEESLEKVDK